MKHILLLLTAICLYTNAHSCSCAHEPGARGFCTVVDESQNNPMFCVVQAKVISWYQWGMNVQVLDQVRASTAKDTIVVWGDNGACCRPNVSGTFHLGDTIVMCLERTDYMGNVLSPSQPDYELSTHYVLQGCGVYFMRYRNGMVTGLFDNNNVNDTIEYNDFKSRVHHCIQVAGIGPTQQPGISIYPNPTDNIVKITSPAIINEIRLFNALGQCVLTKNASGPTADIDLGHMATGIYTLTIYDADRKTLSHHKVVRQ